MANVFDVADFFIDIANKNTDDTLTNLKLNKLLYYAQGEYLARTGKPLFDDEIQAWDYGPVVPVIFYKYKRNNANEITPITDISPEYSFEVFSFEELSVLLDVVREKGQYTGYKLISMTHSESPWKNAYKPNLKGTIISNDSLMEFFSSHPIKKFEISKKVKRLKKIPKQDYYSNEDEQWKDIENED